MTDGFIFHYNSISFTYGGCYDIAKRNEITCNSVVLSTLPIVMLQRLEKGMTVETISKFIPFHPFSPLPPKYKNFYGVRYCGIHQDRPMFYGFDLFYQVTGSGLDLEKFLEFCFTNNLHIDWYNFQRTSKERGKWTFDTLIRKLQYPVIEVYGKHYWEELEKRFISYEKSLLLK